MAPRPRKSRAGEARRGQLRIIAGNWRGRRLVIPDHPGLRPTTDRVRETLFNWLQGVLPGARCLDLFAGAGGLGFEAASRGAAEVVMIERDAAVAAQLESNVTLLKADKVRVVHADALAWLEHDAQPFDIVFIDPPFASDLAETALDRLQSRGWLKPDTRVYLEQDAKSALDPAPAWETLRDQTAGQARYRLLRRDET